MVLVQHRRVLGVGVLNASHSMAPSTLDVPLSMAQRYVVLLKLLKFIEIFPNLEDFVSSLLWRH